LIAELIADDRDGYLTVRKAVVPSQIINNSNDSPVMHFFKWPQLTTNEQFKFKPNDYLGEYYSITKEFEDAYIQLTSGIQIASGIK